MVKLNVIASLSEMTKRRSLFNPAQTIGFVPTMGYLHKGHLSLVKKAREENDIVIVSIFVNPTQFGPKEDLSRYPRDLERDFGLLEELGADVIFTPSAADIYPKDFQTYIDPVGPPVNEAEGAVRPGHFKGVATVVLKLFNIIHPTNVYFGQKDAQQVLVIANMIRDLNLSINLRILPTIRETDGLAMSSRNAYLTGTDREAATILYRSLLAGKQASQTTKDIDEIRKAITEIFSTESKIELEYIEIRHAKTFEQLKTLKAPALFLIAAKTRTTRLIDNFVLQEDNTWNTGVKL
jgi:pantoate--beta-alanine ligase